MDIIEKYYYSEKEQKLLQDYVNELEKETEQHNDSPE
jgi:hypothetical protein